VLERVARRGKPGIRNLRALLVEREGLDFSRSLLEARGEELLRSAGFVGWEREFPVPWDHRLRFDIGFPRHRVAIEWDSVRWHADRGAFQSDRARDRAAATLGWTVLRFTWTDVVTNPLHVIDDVRLVLSRRST
ncbi:MAG: DUF559 domain-containing protein, partial [Acidimicrobiia bacterium]|nr:DUF559 domain-containing protein [Acidimicrobiia bacterium]